MRIIFDKYNRVDTPSFTLCNPNGEQLAMLDDSLDINVNLNFNTLSELSMRVLSTQDAYKYVNIDRVISVDTLGKFIIAECPESSNGIETSKQIRALSLEKELVGKNTGQIKGTFKFYDISPTNIPNTILGKLMSRLNGLWTIGHVDIELMNIYRTFDVLNQSLYNFMVQEVEQTYGCIFKFDTLNRQINAYTAENAVSSTDIYLSYENLIKDVEIAPQEAQLCTALEVIGGGDLDIRQVNPLGTNFIYDFSYYINKGYMSTELIASIISWQNKVDLAQNTYGAKLLELKTLQEKLISLTTELVELENDKKALLQQQQVAVDASNQSEVNRINQLIKAKNTQIAAKNSQITNQKSSITSKQNELKAINASVSFNANFTANQLKELSLYIREQSFQEPNIIKTPEMSDVQIMENAKELYNKGKYVLSKVSKARYTFTMNAVNFLSNPEYATFISQLELGSKILIDVDNGFDIHTLVNKKVEDYFGLKVEDLFGKTMDEMFYDKQTYIEPIVLQISFSYTNPSELSITFGDRLRLPSEDLDFEELMGQTVNTTTQVNGNSINWNDWIESGSQAIVNDFVNSALDASKNELISSDNQQITMGAYGLQGKQLDISTGQYSPQQVWLTSKNLCFTRNSWDSVSTAIGEVTLPNGQKSYGLTCDKIKICHIKRDVLI